MLRAWLELHRRTGEAVWLDKAKNLAVAAQALIRPSTGAWRDSLKWSHLMVEADLELHGVTGDSSLLHRAAADTAWHYSRWKARPHPELIINASLARQLWLMALHRRGAGEADKEGAASASAAAPAAEPAAAPDPAVLPHGDSGPSAPQPGQAPAPAPPGN